jgi:DNA-binding response OmpR family regulator
MRVLIIEDEDHLRHLIRLTLEAAGYEAAEAADGETGLETFGDGRQWDAVLLDQRLPGIDGLETLRRMRQRNPAACVVMITAYGTIELAVEAMKAGARDFLRKPVSPESLRGALKAALVSARTGAHPTVTEGAVEQPHIMVMTMNGFQIIGADAGVQPSTSANEHRFTVLQHSTGERHDVVVTVDADEVARVARLSRHDLKPQGAFWRGQAERMLAGYLWTEGRFPAGDRLELTDVSRDIIDIAAAWSAD